MTANIKIPYIFLLSIQDQLFPEFLPKFLMVGMAFEYLISKLGAPALLILMTGRILREPAAEHPNLLRDHLMDAPEA